VAQGAEHPDIPRALQKKREGKQKLDPVDMYKVCVEKGLREPEQVHAFAGQLYAEGDGSWLGVQV
jgi:hypothetical protein